MGCGGPGSVKYNYNSKERTIPHRELQIINKWTKGALARRAWLRTINLNKLANLRVPSHWDKASRTLVYSKETLMSEKEVFAQFDRKAGAAKTLYWNGFHKHIGEGKTYMGQW